MEENKLKRGEFKVLGAYCGLVKIELFCPSCGEKRVAIKSVVDQYEGTLEECNACSEDYRKSCEDWRAEQKAIALISVLKQLRIR